MSIEQKIVVFGAAGLVGQNLCLRLHQCGYKNIVGIDKSDFNSKILESLKVCSCVINENIENLSSWAKAAEGASIFIFAHAQISGLYEKDFVDNNIKATRSILDYLKNKKDIYVIHISSSVVNSLADDFYTQTKEVQEKEVIKNLSNYCVLRPTLMFGWFDRKHFGWLSRFMGKVPIFPIPGNGNYSRQPLYVGDFCKIIIKCIDLKPRQKVFDISGMKKISYIEIIRTIKKISHSKAVIVLIPVFLFRLLLKLYSFIFKNPPFTTSQLDALIIPEDFPTDNWEREFNIESTNFEIAMTETLKDPRYSNIELKF